jgi:outer membrane protein W
VEKSGLSRVFRRLGIAAVLGATLLPASAATAAPAAVAKEYLNDRAFTTGAQWLSLRFGYARERYRFSPNGNVGYGFGYSRMVSNKLSLGANVQHDLLGKFGGSALIAVPATFEAIWHFHWPSPVHPYVGAGVGTVYRKVYRTGADFSSMEPSYGANAGFDAPCDRSHLLGIDFRVANVANDSWSVDPVFGLRRANSLLLSLKLNYSLTY